jgi:hypothetical protein
MSNQEFKPRALWELRAFKEHRLVAKGDIKFIIRRMLGIEGGIYGSTHFIIPSGGYTGHFKKL